MTLVLRLMIGDTVEFLLQTHPKRCELWAYCCDLWCQSFNEVKNEVNSKNYIINEGLEQIEVKLWQGVHLTSSTETIPTSTFGTKNILKPLKIEVNRVKKPNLAFAS